jgi:type II secretory pathway pseudopilin PulG
MMIVLVVIGIITAAAIPTVNSLMRQKKENDTKKQMNEIKQVILTYYVKHESLPSPVTTAGAPAGYQDYTLPIDALELPPSGQIDKIYTSNYYGYVSTNEGAPFDSLVVDGYSIGTSAAVIVSRGRDLTFNANNENLADGDFTEQIQDGFDDFLVYVTEGELEAAMKEGSYSGPDEMVEIATDIPLLNATAEILAKNDDDVDSYVDEWNPGQPQDRPGDWDGLTDWTHVDAGGVSALMHAGLIWNPANTVDPWGNLYIWDSSYHGFYSAGPDGQDDGGGGDDITYP